MAKIEELLGLTPEIIERREKALKLTIRTIPGTEFLRVMAKRFEVQPWPFISYLAHYAPDEFMEFLDRYRNYDGAESSQIVLEGLREEYIIYSLLLKKMEEKNTIDVSAS